MGRPLGGRLRGPGRSRRDSQVSSYAFGGEDLGDLYITTAHEAFGPADLAREPLASGLFRWGLQEHTI